MQHLLALTGQSDSNSVSEKSRCLPKAAGMRPNGLEYWRASVWPWPGLTAWDSDLHAPTQERCGKFDNS